MEVTDLSTLLSTFPGSVSQERKGVRNPDTVMQGKKEELREFKLSRKLLEELPDAVEEEQKHWCLRRGKLRGWNCGDLKGNCLTLELGFMTRLVISQIWASPATLLPTVAQMQLQHHASGRCQRHSKPHSPWVFGGLSKPPLPHLSPPTLPPSMTMEPEPQFPKIPREPQLSLRRSCPSEVLREEKSPARC